MFIKRIKKNNGFTLTEIIVTVAIFSLIIIVSSKFFGDIFRYEDIFSGGLSAYDEARQILQPVASEIRSASPSSLGGYPIESASENSFVFFADLDGDGLKERIRYYLSGSILMRGIINPTGNPLEYDPQSEITSEIVHGVINGSTPIFTYYDSNYNGNSSPLISPFSVLLIRLVKINLIIDKDINNPPSEIMVTTQVVVRNLKDNL